MNSLTLHTSCRDRAGSLLPVDDPAGIDFLPVSPVDRTRGDRFFFGFGDVVQLALASVPDSVVTLDSESTPLSPDDHGIRRPRVGLGTVPKWHFAYLCGHNIRFYWSDRNGYVH